MGLRLLASVLYPYQPFSHFSLLNKNLKSAGVEGWLEWSKVIDWGGWMPHSYTSTYP